MFGESLLDELKKDLENNNYFLCFDNLTTAGKNITVLEARYFKTDIINEMPITQIYNRVVGIKYLSDSTTRKTMHEIIKEKLLNLSEEVRNNLIGLAHGHAGNLSGKKIGLHQM